MDFETWQGANAKGETCVSIKIRWLPFNMSMRVLKAISFG